MLRFIFGASGAGKSTTLYRSVIEQSLREKDRNFLILVPDQFTMQTQHDVVCMHPQQGIFNIDVLSFSRLTHRVFDETGYPEETLLDDLGKTLVLRHVAETMKKELPVIGKGMHKAGFTDEVKSFLSELMQYDMTPDSMQTLIDAAASRPGLQAKLTDLQKLYRAFETYIAGTYQTVEETLAACAARVPHSSLLKDAVIAFDGFTGFTPVQYGLIRAICKQASDVIVTVTIDPDTDPFTEDEASLFSLSKKTVRHFLHAAYEAGRETDPVHTPPFEIWAAHRREHAHDLTLQSDPVVRLKDNPALSFLERHLFRYDGAVYPEKTAALHLVAASSLREEVRQTFRSIRRLLREDNSLQYRDIAIVCANPSDYEDRIAQASEDFAIPVYQDQTNKLQRNPLIEYLRGIPEVIRTRFSADAVFCHLRSGFCDEEAADIDLLERYVRSRSIRGRKMWSARFVRPLRDGIERSDAENLAIIERLEAVRERMMERFAKLLQVLDENGDVRALTFALFQMMEDGKAQERMERYAGVLEEEGELVRAAQYRQIPDKVVSLFETMVHLLGSERMRIAEYADLLENGFSGVKVGTIPQSVDRVTVGDLERTRLKEVRVLFLLGAGDHAIPKSASGGGLLSEVDRLFLSRVSPDVELAPSPAEQMLIQRLYLYMFLTRPKDALYLSCPAQTPDAGSVRSAFFMKQIAKLFPACEEEMPENDPAAMQAETARDLMRGMGEKLRAYADHLSGEDDTAFLTLYREVAVKDKGADQMLRQAAFFQYLPRPLQAETVRALYGETHTGSATRFERFAACPYAHFLHDGLRVKERIREDIDRADLGTVYHGVLERVTQVMQQEGIAWNEVTDTDAKRIVQEQLNAYAAEYADAKLYDQARNRVWKERIGRVLNRTVLTIREQLKRGDFVPAKAEQGFVREIMRGGVSVRLSGRIDRIDIAKTKDRTYVKIVDFKSSLHDFDAASLLHGLQLQLVLYMDAVLERERKRQGGDVVPAAMLYFRIADPLVNTDESGEDTDRQWLKKLRPTGLVNGSDEALHLLDHTLEQSASDVIPVAKAKDGSLRASSAVFSEEEYRIISDYTAHRIAATSGAIAAGDITVSPYEMDDKQACQTCAYGSVCGFDTTLKGFSFRRLEKPDTQEALEQMKGVL